MSKKYINGLRICYKCKKEKTLEEFVQKKNKTLGRDYICKVCQAIKSAIYLRGYRSKKPLGQVGMRWSVLQRDKFTCQYCGATAPEVKLEIDHIFPRSKGGGDGLDNLITACQSCNLGKRDCLLG